MSKSSFKSLYSPRIKPPGRGAEANGAKNTPLAVCGDVVSSVVGVYVLVILAVFPLYARDMYYDILVDKYFFFWISTAVTAGISAVIGLIGLFIDLQEYKGAHAKAFFAQFSLKGGRLLVTLKEKTSIPDRFLIGFMLVAALSTVCSEWPYEAFWGNMGRYQGLFLWFWYAAAYFLITRFFRFRQWYMDVLLAVGLYVAVWGIQDYLNLDPHGWTADIAPKQKGMFVSSIGNINTYTAVIALYMAVSSTLFVTEGNFLSEKADKKEIGCSVLRVLYYGAAAVIFFVAIITGRSDNAVAGVAFLLCFLPFYAWRNRRGLARYCFLLTGLLAAMLISKELTLLYPNPYAGFWSGILIGLCEKEWLTKLFLLSGGFAFAVLLLLLLIGRNRTEISDKGLFFRLRMRLTQRLPIGFRGAWLLLGVIAGAALVWLFRDANHGGHPEWYQPYANIFYFNNDWGTHRGHNWSILMRHIQEFPLWKKLIGAGPETYGIVTRLHDYNEMLELYNEIYDSPHNEFLQYLFTTGILGFIGYYGFIAASCVKCFRSKRMDAGNYCAAAGAFSALCYAATSFVNISVPIVVPLMLIMLLIGSADKKA